MNFCLDTHFYPLGSSTMKYNPRVNEIAAANTGFTRSHPRQPEALAPYLPGPVVEKMAAGSGQTTYTLVMPPKSIGRLTAHHGNFGVLVRAFSYIAMLGEAGLRAVALNTVLNANYLNARDQPGAE
jgi:glycine dehydrogenase subunit 2